MNEGEGPETFFARQDRVKAKGINGNGMGAPLTLAATMWPTPATRDYKGANGSEHLENGSGRLHLDQLPNFVQHLWYTPNVPNGGRKLMDDASPTGMTPSGIKRQVGLENQVRLWATPRSSDGEKGGPNQSFGAGGIPLPAQVSSFSLPDRQISKDGKPSSPDRRSLNPLFVEWLMGWAPGWTLLAWTDFACSATELSRWKQRMRSALSQLASPHAAPPAQLALVG